MDEGKIVLIGNETDLLHCGYSHAIKDSGKRYPSAVHYTHCMILTQLNVDESAVDELLCTQSQDVPRRAQQLLLENMPHGHDMNSLASYLQGSRQSYTMQGLRLRVEQDQDFEKTLMDTNEALLIVCDSRDRELGIGMDEKIFMDWMAKEKADARQLGFWMKNEASRPADLGQNQLGFFLMWIRYEVKERRKASLLTREVQHINGLSTDKDDKPVKISVNDLIISLQGIFRPLSNYYPFPFEMKGERYRSVEHYAYEKLFNALKLDDKMIEKIQTTPLPVDVPVVADRIFRNLEISSETISEKISKMDRWRQSAMKHKIVHNEYLQQLLLSTGDSIIIDTALGDSLWTCGASETELQRLLTKAYVNPERIIDWMRGDKDGHVPKSVSNLYGNKTGLLLMELRGKLAAATQSRIPLISPINTSTLSAIVSPHVICFTAESVWHPLYPAEIRVAGDQALLPSPSHYVALQATKILGMNKEDSDYIMECQSSLDCWTRLHEVIESKGRNLEREQNWWMEKRQQTIKESLQLLLEQHPPLLRALLDTGDSLLVFCSRFSSIDAELSIGMRESDFRVWMHEVDITTKQLIELCCRPMAFRPPYLGGNRLGLILMELRREFVLKGIFPQNLPELLIGVDTILGSDSPAENMITLEYFDILQPFNYSSLWINPLFLLAKTGNSEAMLACCRVKQSPRLVTVDDEKISEIVEKLGKENEANTEEDVEYLNKIAPEDLRAVFMKYCVKMRNRMNELDRQNGEMQMMAMETHRLQTIRRSLADTKEKEVGPTPGSSTSAPPLPPSLVVSAQPANMHRIAAGRENTTQFDMSYDYSEMEEDKSRHVKKEKQEYKIPTIKRSFGKDRGNDERRNNQYNSGRKNNDQESSRKRQLSPRKPEVIKKPPPEVVAPPIVPPKPKRNPDEELSDGEILSTDEEDNS
ncbi:unnamed protein product [Caenorhabditis angaria]|uniref:NADAR domain-containing protein n=1 Tax=Caenorhabditis angaria TaxID=860376 RepID=A0A9P1IHW8_9PELO|nr:unnamed protein product [Caenorhabditis angaria]